MDRLTLCAPCLFGMEGLLRDEIIRLGVADVRAVDGRVTFSGGFGEIVEANLRLRTAERVLIEMGCFPAETFDALFEGVKAMPWEEFIPENGAFPVKGFSLGSKLTSIPSCQRIIKKAVVERLRRRYRTDWFREEGARYGIQFAIRGDAATVYLDTSGDGLHKRGYRPRSGVAPLRETLAAGMVLLSRYRGGGAFADPFCGSGTLPIEAALIAKNRAPGLRRHFDAERWGCVPGGLWSAAREAAVQAEYGNVYDIWGGDVDGDCAALAAENAANAGVDDCVRVSRADAGTFTPKEDTVTVTNPPYGERLDDRGTAERCYRALSRRVRGKLFLLSAHPGFERVFGREADKKRKLYNGMIKCNLYMYYK